MVYWMSTQEVFENSTTTSFLDAQLNRVDYSMKGVRFLEPDALDPVTKIFQNEESEPLTKGYAVEPDSVPKNLCWHSGNRHIPDVVKCAAASLLVSQKVRDIIDAIEPGVHQLLPVDVFRPKALKEGTGPFARYYWLVVCQRIDSVDPLHTTYERLGRNRDGVWELNGDPTMRIVFSKSSIAGRHIWIDPYVVGGLQVSNTLGEALAAAKLVGVGLKQVEEV
jgi:hypothetical protein